MILDYQPIHNGSSVNPSEPKSIISFYSLTTVKLASKLTLLTENFSNIVGYFKINIF